MVTDVLQKRSGQGRSSLREDLCYLRHTSCEDGQQIKHNATQKHGFWLQETSQLSSYSYSYSEDDSIPEDPLGDFESFPISCSLQEGDREGKFPLSAALLCLQKMEREAMFVANVSHYECQRELGPVILF